VTWSVLDLGTVKKFRFPGGRPNLIDVFDSSNATLGPLGARRVALGCGKSGGPGEGGNGTTGDGGR
jgi:hypothetical protein